MTSKQRWTLGLTSVAALMIMLDALAVTTALTEIRLDLGARIEELEWTINAYTLSFAVLLMAGAALGDRYGRRRVLTIGLAVFALASGGCAIAPNIGALVAARAVQGAGSAMVMPIALALLGAAFGPEQRAKALGLFAGVTGLATLGGPVVGGAVAEGIGWQWIFWLNVPIGIVLIALVVGRLAESTGQRRRLDPRGIALAGAGAFGLVWGLVRGNAAGWASAEVLLALSAGVLLTATFVLWELRAPAPMLPMRLFAARGFAAGNAAGFFTAAATFGAAFFLAQYLQTVMQFGPLGAGLRLLPWTVALFVVAPIAGSQVNRYGERRLLAFGLTLQAAGLAWIAAIADPGMGYPSMIPPLVVAGVGVSMAMPTAQSAVLRAVPPQALGAASGALNTFRQLGGTFGIAVPAAAFASVGGYESVQEFTDGFTAGIAAAAALSLAGAVVALRIPTRTVPNAPTAKQLSPAELG